jgi:hypothetical protein
MPNENITSVGFWDIFKRGQNDTLITKVPIRIGTARFESETVVEKGSLLGGINFHQQVDRNIGVTITPSGLYVIKGVYLPE